MEPDGQLALGVWVPRELNTDPDLLSHPSNREAVERAAREAGWCVVWLDVPQHCWEALEAVIRSEGGE